MVICRNDQKRDSQMPVTLKLSKAEQEGLRKKSIEINKILIKMEKSPVRESELAHLILEKSMNYLNVSASGNIVIEGLE